MPANQASLRIEVEVTTALRLNLDAMSADRMEVLRGTPNCHKDDVDDGDVRECRHRWKVREGRHHWKVVAIVGIVGMMSSGPTNAIKCRERFLTESLLVLP